MKKLRLISIILAMLLLLSFYACTSSDGDSANSLDSGDSGVSAQIPDPPSTSAAPEQSPTPSAGSPAPSADDSAPGASESVAETPDEVRVSGEVIISFNYVRQSGAASNQHAVWIEDMDGNVVRTLFASRWTANGGYKTRPDSIALWVEKAGLATMTKSEVDAVSGATPASSRVSYSWDLTGSDGTVVSSGDYRFFVEGTLRWKNFVLYSGVITLGDSLVSVNAEAEYSYQGDGRYAALTSASVENDMIGPVTATFTKRSVKPLPSGMGISYTLFPRKNLPKFLQNIVMSTRKLLH